jgi:hypothetical protein
MSIGANAPVALSEKQAEPTSDKDVSIQKALSMIEKKSKGGI